MKSPSKWWVEHTAGKTTFGGPLSRLMRGGETIVGWTQKPFSDVFQQIADAHNKEIQTLYEKAITDRIPGVVVS